MQLKIWLLCSLEVVESLEYRRLHDIFISCFVAALIGTEQYRVCSAPVPVYSALTVTVCSAPVPVYSALTVTVCSAPVPVYSALTVTAVN